MPAGPFAATGAALDYLQKLHTDFNGDWLLALAAYNCGEDRVQREIDSNRAKGLRLTSGAFPAQGNAGIRATPAGIP